MLRSLLGMASAAFFFGVGGAAAQALDADAMARVPNVTRVDMSPDGTALVGIVADPRNTDDPALASWDISSIDTSKPLAPKSITPSEGRMAFQGAQIFKTGKVIVLANQAWTGALNGCGEGKTTGSTKTYVYKAFLTDTSIKKFDDVLAKAPTTGISAATLRCLELATSPSIMDLPLDPENVIVRRLDTVSLESRYLKVNLKTGRTENLYRDTGDQQIDLIDPRDGRVRTKVRVKPIGNLEYESETYILNPDTGNFDLQTPLTVSFSDRRQMNVQAYDEKTGKYFVVTDKFSDKAAVYLYDAKTQKFDDEPLFRHEAYDATGVVLGRHPSDFGKILGFRYWGPDPMVYWVDPELKSIAEGLSGAFKGQNVELKSWTDDRSKLLFVVESPRNPPAYYLLLNKSKVVSIGGERPWIKPDSLGDRSLVYYEARDGLKIPAFLTLPPDWKKGDAPPPAVVLPHGGPWARDELGWDPTGWTQFLATRGYAVLQPQYRGSEGWGHQLWLAGDFEWGKKMQDDNDDGANWMVANGYAAKDRIAIFGYSYGGFAAFAASVRPGGPFKCAIAGAGVSNLQKTANNWGENREQRSFQGRTVTGMDPIQNTDKLSMPILIFHGDHDVRVPLYNSTDFYNAVKSTGNAKLVIMKDMGHQMDKWTADNVRESLGVIGDFLKNDCKL
ncbi:MAG: prolyl oligopeptidase family serine peptidase [Alphaproteobacteria bacterium]|nr:prolyl oligopeptidase family serine peptidase [Alphaproteobacteria bacterium]